MKILGYQINPIRNKIESPQTEKVGKFTYERQASPRRTVDIGEFIKALQQAESTRNPLRYRLYDLYQESIDYVPHLRALMELRYLNLMNKNLIYTINDEPVDDMAEWLQSPEFKKFIKDILDTKFWGFSLFDFTDSGKEWFSYDLVSRKHVDPIREVVYRNQTGSGAMPYNTPERKKYTIAVGDKTDLGLLKNATPIAIHLRNMTGDMMNYVELAGNNFTVYKDSSNDPRIANQILEAEKNKSTSGFMKLPVQVEREIENQSSSQQNQLFTGVHDLLNKELSKLMLGSTMGIEDGSSLSQAEVHERTMGKVFQSDDQFVLDVLNFEFTDKLVLWGRSNNGVFEFENDNDDSETKEIAKDIQLQQLGLNLTPEYLAEKYGIPTEAIKQTTPNDTPENK